MDANRASTAMRWLEMRRHLARTDRPMVLKVLLVVVPATIMDRLQAPLLAMFAAAGLTVIPLAALVGRLSDEKAASFRLDGEHARLFVSRRRSARRAELQRRILRSRGRQSGKNASDGAAGAISGLATQVAARGVVYECF